MPMLQSMRKHVITLMILHNAKYRTGDIFSRPVSFYETVLLFLSLSCASLFEKTQPQ